MLVRTTRFMGPAICLTVAAALGAAPSLGAQSVPVYSTGSTVSVTYLGGPAADNDALYWFLAPGSSTNQLLLTNHNGISGPTTINHVFTSGSEVVFGLQDNSVPNVFYSGGASRNGDDLPHFWVDMISGNSLRATMTDRSGQSSDQFQTGGGFQFEVTGVSTTPATTTTTPEPSSMALLGTGLIGLIPMIRRRLKA